MFDENNDDIDNKKQIEKQKKSDFKWILALIVATNILTFYITGVLAPKIQTKNTYGNMKVEDVERFVRKNYLRDINEEDMIDGKLKGVLASLKDPYSSYMTKDEFSALLEETHGSFGGIGVVVGVDIDRDLLQIISPIKDGPGDKAGLKAGDYILEVDGKPYKGQENNEAVKAMKGEPGTKVKLTIGRNLDTEKEETKIIEIDRDIIKAETVSSQMLEDNMGYIRISSFDDNTFVDFEAQMKELEAKGMKSLIIDLRNNPGGVLDITANIADLFLDKGDIVYTENKEGKREYLKSNSKKVDYPLAILVNQGSASASEVLSGALRDRDRAKLVGTKTFGKGVVQRLVDLGDGTGLKLTISEYFTPSGTKIDGIGITPDYVVDLPEDVKVIGVENLEEDVQLQKAIEILK